VVIQAHGQTRQRLRDMHTDIQKTLHFQNRPKPLAGSVQMHLPIRTRWTTQLQEFLGRSETLSMKACSQQLATYNQEQRRAERDSRPGVALGPSSVCVSCSSPSTNVGMVVFPTAVVVWGKSPRHWAGSCMTVQTLGGNNVNRSSPTRI
jgi:hypothetical protein